MLPTEICWLLFVSVFSALLLLCCFAEKTLFLFEFGLSDATLSVTLQINLQYSTVVVSAANAADRSDLSDKSDIVCNPNIPVVFYAHKLQFGKNK
ncbi:MAG: hypothetical protein E7047_04670 [Lentisphaerae bacterium]|nr:hypothetical protein [Lentisphaerota bacterium]